VAKLFGDDEARANIFSNVTTKMPRNQKNQVFPDLP